MDHTHSFFKRKNPQFAQMLDSFAIAQMTKDTQASFHEAGMSLYESLPQQVKKTMDAAKALDDLKRAAEDIDKNRLLMNALDLAMLLAKVAWAKENAADMFNARHHATEYATVREMWWVKVQVHCEKCQKAKKLSELIKKYSALSAAIRSWNFETVPWVLVEKDSERDKMGKDVQEVLLQIGVASNTMDRIAREMEAFAEKQELKVAADALAVLKVAELQVRPCQILVSEMILCGMFVVGERNGKTVEQIRAAPEFKPALQYVKTGLKVNVADLDKNLRDRIMGSAPVTEPASSSSAPVADAETETNASEPKKKRARLGAGPK